MKLFRSGVYSILTIVGLLFTFMFFGSMKNSTATFNSSDLSTYNSADTVILEDVRITDEVIQSIPLEVKYLLIRGVRIKELSDFSNYKDLESLLLIDCKSDELLIDNPNLKVLRIIDGSHHNLTLESFALGLYLDVSNSGVEEIHGLKKIEDRVQFFFYAYNDPINGLEEIWFTNLYAYSYAHDVMLLNHNPTTVRFVFNIHGSQDIYKYLHELGGPEVIEYRFTEYAQRYHVYSGSEILRTRGDSWW